MLIEYLDERIIEARELINEKELELRAFRELIGESCRGLQLRKDIQILRLKEKVLRMMLWFG